MVHRTEIIGDCVLHLGDCLDIIPTLDKVDHVICDPPYEAAMQDNWGNLADATGFERFNGIKKNLIFKSIDSIRDEVSYLCISKSNGWFIAFCMAEGVGYWRDSIEKYEAKYKRAMVWIKPDAMPQFNGQGPGMGHEMMVSAWCGSGHSKWNGGGRHGTFYCPKGGSERTGDHPTEKPIPLMRELVNLFSNQHETILDPFMGSGTTGVACVKLGRKFIGIEMEEKYFDLSCRRIEQSYKQPDFFIQPPEKFKQESFI